MVNNHLKIIVLKILGEKSSSGYDLMKKIRELTGWKPSFGSLYPLLKELHEKGMVTIKQSERKKVYSLTIKGKKTLEQFMKSKDELVHSIKNSFNVMQSICDTGDVAHLNVIMNHLENPVLFGKSHQEVEEFRNVFFKMAEDGRFKRHEAEMRKILREATDKMKKLK